MITTNHKCRDSNPQSSEKSSRVLYRDESMTDDRHRDHDHVMMFRVQDDVYPIHLSI